ncbi:MAG: hypothetical protein D6681_19105 [Calditrichaeota bacterium]|nr:MAG: hypothetical protein D6681_19105 [Calditrichota bacterium]
MDMDFLIPIAFFATIAFIIKTVSENRTRRLWVQMAKLDKEVPPLYPPAPQSSPLESVKWGMVLIGIGLAFLLGQLFPEQLGDGGTIGLAFLFSGIGFLLYYRLAKATSQKNGQEDGEGKNPL